ncbi:MAG: SIMPL domain-containing protein [Alphaproteobacteria bacterium]|nr:MAG: SIMPL domain-containing protein [Alphaproteobacteria bacterium]
MHKQLNSLIISGAVVLSAFLISAGMREAFSRTRSGIDVKGYAEKTIDSDVIKWKFRAVGQGKTLAQAHHQLQEYADAIRQHLNDQGILSNATWESPLYTSSEKKYITIKDMDKETRQTAVEKYEARKEFTVTSTEIDKIEKASKSIDDLVGKNINLRTLTIEYFANTLNAAKSELLSLATRNAYERAQTLANASHSKIKGILKARQGVFQITPEYSTESSDNGYFDTSSRRKTVKAIAAITFDIGE